MVNRCPSLGDLEGRRVSGTGPNGTTRRRGSITRPCPPGGSTRTTGTDVSLPTRESPDGLKVPGWTRWRCRPTLPDRRGVWRSGEEKAIPKEDGADNTRQDEWRVERRVEEKRDSWGTHREGMVWEPSGRRLKSQAALRGARRVRIGTRVWASPPGPAAGAPARALDGHTRILCPWKVYDCTRLCLRFMNGFRSPSCIAPIFAPPSSPGLLPTPDPGPGLCPPRPPCAVRASSPPSGRVSRSYTVSLCQWPLPFRES